MERKEAGVVVLTAAICTVVGLAVGTALTMATLSDADDEKVTYIVTEQDMAYPEEIVLSPCPTEDSHDCYWDASTMGNGYGTSFVDIDGVLYFAEMR